MVVCGDEYLAVFEQSFLIFSFSCCLVLSFCCIFQVACVHQEPSKGAKQQPPVGSCVRRGAQEKGGGQAGKRIVMEWIEGN